MQRDIKLIDIFKTLKIKDSNINYTTKGDVTQSFDKDLGKRVFRIKGQVMMNNNLTLLTKNVNQRNKNNFAQQQIIQGNYLYLQIMIKHNQHFCFMVELNNNIKMQFQTQLSKSRNQIKTKDGVKTIQIGLELKYIYNKWSVIVIDLEEQLQRIINNKIIKKEKTSVNALIINSIQIFNSCQLGNIYLAYELYSLDQLIKPMGFKHSLDKYAYHLMSLLQTSQEQQEIINNQETIKQNNNKQNRKEQVIKKDKKIKREEEEEEEEEEEQEEIEQLNRIRQEQPMIRRNIQEKRRKEMEMVEPVPLMQILDLLVQPQDKIEVQDNNILFSIGKSLIKHCPSQSSWSVYDDPLNTVSQINYSITTGPSAILHYNQYVFTVFALQSGSILGRRYMDYVHIVLVRQSAHYVLMVLLRDTTYVLHLFALDMTDLLDTKGLVHNQPIIDADISADSLIVLLPNRVLKYSIQQLKKKGPLEMAILMKEQQQYQYIRLPVICSSSKDTLHVYLMETTRMTVQQVHLVNLEGKLVNLDYQKGKLLINTDQELLLYSITTSQPSLVLLVNHRHTIASLNKRALILASSQLAIQQPSGKLMVIDTLSNQVTQIKPSHSTRLVQIAICQSQDLQASLAEDNTIHTYQSYTLDYQFNQYDEVVAKLGWQDQYLVIAYRSLLVRVILITDTNYEVLFQQVIADTKDDHLIDMIIGEQYMVFQIGTDKQLLTDKHLKTIKEYNNTGSQSMCFSDDNQYLIINNEYKVNIYLLSSLELSYSLSLPDTNHLYHSQDTLYLIQHSSLYQHVITSQPQSSSLSLHGQQRVFPQSIHQIIRIDGYLAILFKNSCQLNIYDWSFHKQYQAFSMAVQIDHIHYDPLNKLFLIAIGNAIVRWSWLGYTTQQMDNDEHKVLDLYQLQQIDEMDQPQEDQFDNEFNQMTFIKQEQLQQQEQQQQEQEDKQFNLENQYMQLVNIIGYEWKGRNKMVYSSNQIFQFIGRYLYSIQLNQHKSQRYLVMETEIVQIKQKSQLLYVELIGQLIVQVQTEEQLRITNQVSIDQKDKHSLMWEVNDNYLWVVQQKHL